MTMQALRIAIVLQTPERPPDWCMRLVERICSEDGLELCALLKPPADYRGPSGNPLIKAWSLFERKLAAKPEPADIAAYSNATGKLPLLTVEDCADIKRLGLDVILDLSGDFGRSWTGELARHGIWFFDFLCREPGCAGMLPITSQEPTTNIALFRRSADHAGNSGIATAELNTKFIATRNELYMSEKSVPLALRELRRTRLLGTPNAHRDLEFSEPRRPGTADFLAYLTGLGAESAARIAEKVLHKIGMRPGMFFLKSSQCDWADFKPAKATAHISGKNSYFADPFLWEAGGSLYCFFEEYDYRTSLGHISVGKFDGDELTEVEVALRTGYHLSFPFLFEHQGQLYMMPETFATRRLEIWKCLEFPNNWALHTTALEGVAAADSTLNLIDGTWWLFTNITNDPFSDMNSELHIFKVDGPDLTRIEPHATNPVVLNSRQARNGGRILEFGGKYYRPSQDNSHGLYGWGINLMEIKDLSLDSYEETAVKSIGPDFERGIIGCHHLDIRSGRVIMDVRKNIGGFAH